MAFIAQRSGGDVESTGLFRSLISGTRRVTYDDAVEMIKWCKEVLQLKSLIDPRVDQGSQQNT